MDSNEGQWVQDPGELPEEKPKRPRGRPPARSRELPQAVAAGAELEVLAAVDAVGVAADGLEYAQAEAMAEVIADEEALRSRRAGRWSRTSTIEI